MSRDRIQSLYQRHDQANPYPDLPPSLNPRHQDEQVPVVHTILPYHTPYLGLRARLSQVWFNRWTILLLLIVVRIILAVIMMENQLDSAKSQALSACTGVESMGSAMASMPHYMAQGVNEAAAKGIEAAVNGLERALTMAITVIEAIVIFLINVVIQTYVCLLTFAIQSSLGTVINAASDITNFINQTLGSIQQDIRNEEGKFQDTLNSFIDGFNDISSFLGSSHQIPQLNLNSVGELNNIQLPHQISDGLNTLNQSLPNFDQANSKIQALLHAPFDQIQTLVNSTLTVYQFNRQLLPVPEKETLTFCSNNDSINNFFLNLHDLIYHVRNILLGVLLALAVLVMIPMAYREWWRYRSMRQRAYMLSAPGNSFDPVDIVQIASRPYSSTVGLKAASWFKSSRRQIMARWFVAYISTPACLFVLSLGLAGLISCLGQYIVLREIQAETPELSNEVGQFADLVVNHLTDASLAWANDANSVVTQTENDINNDVLGWVHNGSLALNDTLNGFVDTMTDGIQQVFNNTPLEQGVQNIFFCLVELKVRGIEKGLTWIYDNSNVSFPRFPNDTFSLGAAVSVGKDATNSSDSFLADSGSEAADKITNVVTKLTNQWEDQLITESYISAALVGIWIVVILIGLIRVFFAMLGRDKTRAEGGARGLTGDGRQTFGDRAAEDKAGAVFPQFNEKSNSDFHNNEYDEEPIPAAIASPSRKGYQHKHTGWTNSMHGDIGHS